MKKKVAVFDLKLKKERFLEKAYEKSMKELGSFYGINWSMGRPSVFIVKTREDIDMLRGHKTERWISGWANDRSIFLLDRNNFAKESSHKKPGEEEYATLLSHELSHLFFAILSDTIGRRAFPVWLWEGVAIYTAGQLKFKKPVKEFKGFLEFYEKHGTEAYTESGFFIEILVKKYGKQKLLDLIKLLKGIKTKKDFDKTFNKIYGFNLNYKEINKLNT